jgi:hypothetical protein
MADGHWKKELEAQVRDFEGRVGWVGVEGTQKKEGLISQEAKRHNC